MVPGEKEESKVNYLHPWDGPNTTLLCFEADSPVPLADDIMNCKVKGKATSLDHTSSLGHGDAFHGVVPHQL